MRPKITIVSPVYPYRGGIANFTEHLYQHLKDFAYVELINFKRQYPDFLFPGKTQFETKSTREIFAERIIDSINPITWNKAARRIRETNPDYIIFAYWHPFFAPAYGKIAKEIGRRNNAKIVALCHNVLSHERGVFDISLARYFFNKVDLAITLSEKVIDDLKLVNENIKTKILFHPVYSNFGEPVKKDEALAKLNIKAENTLLFFGFIRDYKGLDILLEAVVILKNKIDFKLIVAGEFYVDREKYIELIDKLGINDFVVLRESFIPTSEVKYYFSAADAVALPYKEATQSGIIQIANNFLKPVIATDVGGLGEIIKNGYNGYVIEPNNPLALANAIEEFFNNKNKIDFASNVKKESEKFSWEKFTEELMKLFNNDV